MICEKDYRDKTATDATHDNQATGPLFMALTHPNILHLIPHAIGCRNR